MALKFRRGTTAQKSGSLAFGEPYVNTTLGTLQIGLESGDVTLTAIGTGSNISVAGISGSSLDITGNAKIDGNLTLGGEITASAMEINSGSNPELRFVNRASGIQYHIQNGDAGNFQIHNGTTNKLLFRFLSASLDEGNQDAYFYSNLIVSESVIGHSVIASHIIGQTITGSFSGSVYGVGDVVQFSSSVGTQLTNLNTYTGSLNNAIQLTGSTVSFLGDIIVYGTQSIINSTNLAVNDNLIYLNEGSQVSNPDLGIVGNYNDGVYAHGGIFRDASDGGAWKVFEGYTLEPSGTIDTTGNGFTLADFKADVITATSFNGTFNSTNGVISGSSQIDHNSTTNYVANKHIDHTAVTLVAGNGLTGGGDITTNRTFTIGAGSYITVNTDDVAVNTTTLIPAISGTILSSITGDVTISSEGVATIGANSVALGTDTTGNYVASLVAGTNITLSNNSGEGATPTIGLTNNTISGVSLGSNLATLTIGTGLSGTSYNGSGAVTIANTGVTSVSAGTGVTLGATTGACSISIGQSVATTATPTFGNLTINGTITATGDITAFYTSDRRHKSDIQIIPNALDKVKKLNGVTWKWNDDVNEVTKTTPTTGLIAQEVQEVLPQVVVERENGYLGLDYSKMMGLLVEAIKEQQIKIDNLTIEVERLKKQKGL